MEFTRQFMSSPLATNTSSDDEQIDYSPPQTIQTIQSVQSVHTAQFSGQSTRCLYRRPSIPRSTSWSFNLSS